jgi:hypothetical protein
VLDAKNFCDFKATALPELRGKWDRRDDQFRRAILPHQFQANGTEMACSLCPPAPSGRMMMDDESLTPSLYAVRSSRLLYIRAHVHALPSEGEVTGFDSFGASGIEIISDE